MNEKSGKINQYLLTDIIQQNCGYERKEVRVGPRFGVDVSVVDLPNGMSMASTSDPMSLIPSLGLAESAWLSVHLLANDMATTGFAPMYGQFVLNLPSNFSKQDFKTYWQYIDQFCVDIGVAITGGHTGFVEEQNSTVAGGGTFITIAPQTDILTSQFAKPGDAILVTKQCALSATSILAMSFPQTVKNKTGIEAWHQACALFYETSSLQDALNAVGKETRYEDVTAMHDVTEGGVLGAIYEMVSASENGALVINENIPIGQIQKDICNLFTIDPRFSVGAGSMIITCKKDKVTSVIERLKNVKIACNLVGEIKEQSYGIKLLNNDKENNLIYPSTDPYWAAFYKAYKEGWK